MTFDNLDGRSSQALSQGDITEKVFLEFSHQLQDVKDLGFIQDMVETLTITIAASTNYEKFRLKL